jgi:DNA-binding MarR family transcriptional regulator
MSQARRATRGANNGAPAPSEQLDSFVTALVSASRALVAVSVRSLAELDESVTLPQFRTLVILTSHGVTNLNRLAELLGVNASSAVRMIDRLLAAGLVVRQENPADRREVRLEVTPAGAEIVKRVTARRRREIQKIARRMPQAVSDDLIAALTTFAAFADNPDGTSDGEAAALGW